MSELPPTDIELLQRLPLGGEADWFTFVQIYEPFLYRFAHRQGLQDSDAQELTQNVLLAVSQAIDRWQPAGESGPRFRNWLFTIARNQLLNALQRRPADRGVGGSTHLAQLQRQPRSESWRQDYRREVFVWAAERVRRQLSPHNWQAFWRTAVEGQTTSQVAQELDMSVGAVYAARYRALQRIRKEIEAFSEDAADSTRSPAARQGETE